MKDLKSARQRFKSMHSESFVIPNAWSVGEIRQLEKLGFGAIATTSAGLSASMGRKDLSLSRDETLQNIRTVCAATDLPVNADFEAGFSDAAAGVGANVAMAAEAGVSGLSIEDRKGGALYAPPEAVARIKAARAALDKIDPNIVLIGRSEGRKPPWRSSRAGTCRRRVRADKRPCVFRDREFARRTAAPTPRRAPHLAISACGPKWVGDLIADGADRIERRTRILEDHRHRGAMQVAEITPRYPRDVLSAKTTWWLCRLDRLKRDSLFLRLRHRDVDPVGIGKWTHLHARLASRSSDSGIQTKIFRFPAALGASGSR